MKTFELLLAEGEGLTIEFKEKYSSKIVQDIVAFANTKGGTILLGVSDQGQLLGEKLTNVLKAQIIDLGRNCKPAISIQVEKVNDKVIAIHVTESHEKPHMCSDGFFKRFDGLTQKLTPAEVRELFRKNSTLSFESNIVENAKVNDLSIEKVNRFLKESGADLKVNSKTVMGLLENIKLMKGDGLTSASLLMFAKDVSQFFLHSQIFLVAFKGTEGIHIYDKKYVRDDLLTQYNEALLFCEKHLNIRTEIKNGQRKDSYEIPIDVLRETIANAIIHRDYSMTGTNIQIEIHSDRVVVSNPGGLPEGFEIKKLGTKSYRRNEIIADLFSRMDKAERFGSGIKRIKQLLSEAHCDPPYYESDMFFTVTYKRPEEYRSVASSKKITKLKNPTTQNKNKVSHKTSHSSTLSATERILEELRLNPQYTQEMLADKVNLSVEGVRYHIKKLQKLKMIKRMGSRKKGSWKII